MSEYHKLSKMDKILAISGAPLSILRKKIDRNMHQFLPISCQIPDQNNKIISINPHDQINLQEQLYQNTLYLGQTALYTIGSTNSENPAMEYLVELLRKYQDEQFSLKTVPELKWFDMGNIDWSYMKSEADPKIVIIQGLSLTSDNKRLEMVNDILRRYESKTKFVLVKTNNILDFSLNTLKVSPSGVLQFGSLVKRV